MSNELECESFDTFETRLAAITFHPFPRRKSCNKAFKREAVITSDVLCLTTAALRFDAGDSIDMEIDCKQSKLTVRNTTQNLTDSIDLPADKQWRLLVVMFYRNTSVRIVDSKCMI